jgi:CRISPR type III-B/RAMP module RAMP protein Cmr1
MEIEIKTQTPLWTGGIERKVDRIHETGLIGSLRWWYEIILRGLDGRACDPTNHNSIDHSCKDKKHCAACELFGTTGWSRRFRLKVSGDQQLSPDLGEIRVDSCRRGWRLGRGILSEKLMLTALPMRPGKEHNLSELTFLIKFVACWGALGARTQVGDGVFELKKIILNDKVLPAHEIANSLSQIENAVQDRPSLQTKNEKLPDVRDFFFARLRLPTGDQEDGLKWLTDPRYAMAKKRGFLPIAPAVRCEMRGWLHEESDTFLKGSLQNSISLKDLRHCLMGTNQDGNGPLGSKFFTSHLYQIPEGWEFRVWGWVPDLKEYRVRRETLIDDIQQHLGDVNFANRVVGLNRPFQVDEWHCFDRQGSQSVMGYLRELATCGIERDSE